MPAPIAVIAAQAAASPQGRKVILGAIAAAAVFCLLFVTVLGGGAIGSGPENTPGACGNVGGAATAQPVADNQTDNPAPPAAGDSPSLPGAPQTGTGDATWYPWMPAQVGPYGKVAIANAAQIVKGATDSGLDSWGMAVGVMTAAGESGLKVIDRGDAAGPDSRGLFQQRANGAWGSYADRMSPYTSSKSYFEVLMKLRGYRQLPPTIAAHRVQRNADSNYYTPFWSDAVRIVAALLKDPSLITTLPVAGGAADGCGTIAQGNGSITALQATVKNYAWPTNHGQDHLAQTPGYAAAVKKAMATGQFAGHQAGEPAGRPEGDHCSGFVSMVITNSGWDTTYNNGGSIAKGAGFVPKQLAWMSQHWTRVGGPNVTESQLRPGDVGISNGGLTHVWLYVGQIAGFQGNYAEASYLYGSHAGFAPQARQSASPIYGSNGGTSWFRKG